MQTTQDSASIAQLGADDGDRLLDTSEFRAYIKCSERTAIEMRNKDTGPPWLRFGNGRGQIRYRLRDVRAWIASRVQTPGRAA